MEKMRSAAAVIFFGVLAVCTLLMSEVWPVVGLPEKALVIAGLFGAIGLRTLPRHCAMAFLLGAVGGVTLVELFHQVAVQGGRMGPRDAVSMLSILVTVWVGGVAISWLSKRLQ